MILVVAAPFVRGEKASGVGTGRSPVLLNNFRDLSAMERSTMVRIFPMFSLFDSL